MVIITLVVAGVGLALDRREKRNAARTLQQEQAAEELRKQREEEAFAELQSYANFQTSLSSQVLEDLESENGGEPPPRYSYATRDYDSQVVLPPTDLAFASDRDVKSQLSLTSSRDYGSPFNQQTDSKGDPFHSYLDHQSDIKRTSFASSLTQDSNLRRSSFYPSDNLSFRSQSSMRLPSLLVIPQETTALGTRCWTRAYAPSLMSCGVPQDSFLDFIDSFNDLLKTSPNLSTINIASLNPENRNPSILNVSAAIPNAVHEAKLLSHTRTPENAFITSANEALFSPNGLFAMVISSHPDEKSSILNVDFNNTPDNTHPPASNPSTTTAIKTPEPPQPRSKLRQMQQYITPTLSSPTPSQPALPTSDSERNRERSLSPSTLHSLVDAISMSGPHDRKKDSRRLRRRKIGNVPVPHTSSARVEKQRPGSVASFASSASGSGSVRSGLGWENLNWSRNSIGEREREREEMAMDMGWEISPGALYLVIVNDPDSGCD